MDNNSIEEEIQKSAAQYQIKTSSDDILQAYYRQEDKKKVKNKPIYRRFWPLEAGVGLVAASAILFFSLRPLLPGASSTGPIINVIDPQKGVRGGTRSQTAFQIFSGVNLLSSFDTSTISKRSKQSPDLSTFTTIVDSFDRSFPTLASMFEDNIDIPNIIEEGEFSGQYGTYNYRMTIILDQNYVFLNNISFENEDDETETTFTGEIIIPEADSYFVTIEKEEDPSDNELEIEMTIRQPNSTTLTITQEEEEGEKEFGYLLKKNDGYRYEEKISFETEDDEPDSYRVEIVDGTLEYEFDKITKIADNFSVDYRHQNFEGNFELQALDQIRRYTDSDQGWTVEKNIFKENPINQGSTRY